MGKPKAESGKTIESILKEINKEFGEGAAFQVGNAKPVKVSVVSTGSFSLDLALGVGGVPRGRITEIYGPESSGKTSLALSIVAQAQRAGGEAVYIDAEHALDLEYARKLGVRVKDLVVSQPQSGEEALNLAQRFIESGGAAVVVVDSVASLVPMAEDEGEIGQSHMGLQARMMSQAMRKMAGAIARTGTLVVFVNQIRMKLAQAGWGSPEVTSGGMALKFYASVRIDVRRVERLKEGDEFVGNRIRAKVVKNKVAAPFRQAEFYLMFDTGISYEADIFNTALARKVVEKRGATYFFGGEKVAVGARAAVDALRGKGGLAERIKQRILSAEPVAVVQDDEPEI